MTFHSHANVYVLESPLFVGQSVEDDEHDIRLFEDVDCVVEALSDGDCNISFVDESDPNKSVRCYRASHTAPGYTYNMGAGNGSKSLPVWPRLIPPGHWTLLFTRENRLPVYWQHPDHDSVGLTFARMEPIISLKTKEAVDR